MADIFISYRRDPHLERAQLLKDQLEQRGYEVFLDTTMGSGNFNEILKKEIEISDYFLLLISKNSFERCWEPADVYREEIECAYENGKVIIPVIEQGYRFPDRLPKSINFVRDCNAAIYDTQFLKFVVNDLVERFLTKPIEEKNSATKERQPTTYSLIPQNRYTDMSLNEMVNLARRDVSDDYSLYQTVEQAQQGIAVAQVIIAKAYLYEDRMSADSVNPEKGIYWLVKAIEQGDAEAMYLLGECYMNARGVPENHARGAYWYEKSATHSKPYVEAIYAMSDCYYENKGVPDDLLKKAEWYKRAMGYEFVHESKDTVTYAERYYDLFSKKEDRKKLICNGYTLAEMSDYKYKLIRENRKKEIARSLITLGAFPNLMYIISTYFYVGINAEWSRSKDLAAICFVANLLISLGLVLRLKFRRKWVYIAVAIVCTGVVLVVSNLILQAVVYHALSIPRIGAIICGVIMSVMLFIIIYLHEENNSDQSDSKKIRAEKERK